MKERSEVDPKILTLVTVNTRKKFRFQGKGDTFSFNIINLCDILKVIFVGNFLKNKTIYIWWDTISLRSSQKPPECARF